MVALVLSLLLIHLHLLLCLLLAVVLAIPLTQQLESVIECTDLLPELALLLGNKYGTLRIS
jgi:hypothetical protein